MRRTVSVKWEQFKNVLRAAPFAGACVSGIGVILLLSSAGQGLNYWFYLVILLGLSLCVNKRGLVIWIVGVGLIGGSYWIERLGQSQVEMAAKAGLRVEGVSAEVWQLSGRDVWLKLRTDGLGNFKCVVARERLEGLCGGSESGVRIGEKLCVSGGLRGLPAASNPGGFDRAAWLVGQGVYCQLRVDQGFQRGEVSWRGRLVTAGQAVADWLAAGLTRGLASGDRRGEVIEGVVLGRVSALESDQRELFRRSGALHVFAVSGMHVGIVAALAWFVLRWCGLEKHRVCWILIGLMFGYAWVTGFRPSAVRAAWMGAVLLSGLGLRRKSSGLNRLALAAVVMLWWDGRLLFQPGFQLSFLVMASILGVGPLLDRRLPWRQAIDPWLPRQLWTKRQARLSQWVAGVRGMLLMTLAAWLGSAGLTALHFGMVSLAGVLVGVPMIFGAFVVLGLGFAGCLLGAVLPWLGVIVVGVNAWVAGQMVNLASVVGGQGWAALAFGARVSAEEAWIFEAGGGGAVVFGGQPMVALDCGDQYFARYELLPFLSERRGVLGDLVLSHGDYAHVGGAFEVLSEYPEAMVALPAGRMLSPTVRDLSRAGEEQRAKVWTPQRGDWLQAGAGRLVNLGAGAPLTGADRSDDQCSVWQWRINGWSVVFMNDSGFARERELLQSGTLTGVDVLVFGKHQTDLSATADFIFEVGARVVIATHADYPSGQARGLEWEQELLAGGVRVLRLDGTGAIQVQVGKDQLGLEGFKSGEKISLLKSR